MDAERFEIDDDLLISLPNTTIYLFWLRIVDAERCEVDDDSLICLPDYNSLFVLVTYSGC